MYEAKQLLVPEEGSGPLTDIREFLGLSKYDQNITETDYNRLYILA
jgi:hypothetical protein